MAITVLFLLSACSGVPAGRDQSEVLPQPKSLPCCWQAEEHLQVQSGEQQLNLTAIVAVTEVAVTENRLTLVVLDPLGQRWLTVTQQGAALQVDAATDLQSLPIESFIIGLYLRHMDAVHWSSPWAIEKQGELTRLLNNNQPLVEMRRGAETELYYLQSGVMVRITEITREWL